MFAITRRDFLRFSALTASTLIISTGISGCGDNSDDVLQVAFAHGVASGDPLSNQVIIWTRVTPVVSDIESLKVFFEVSKDSGFSQVTNSGEIITKKANDYTVKIDVLNLEAGTVYYYRFKSNGITSTVGKTKTLPTQTQTPSQVKFAVFSCANYSNGYFNPYSEAAKLDDLDATLHLGDYIYEYGIYKDDDFVKKYPAYGTALIDKRPLPADNNSELLVLSDYRKRYALYHTDSGLQAIHAKAPMIVVWDDHEVANDSYKDGADNHNAKEGLFSDRTVAALQAYFEWLPIRPIADKKKIFRSFDFGDLVTLNMLETRLFGRDKQLSYANYYDAQGNFDASRFQADLTSSSRTMLGSEQLGWLQGQMASSKATWQVLGQQVLMGKMNLPAELLGIIAQLEYATETTKPALLEALNAKLVEFVTIKSRILQGDPAVTDAEKTRLYTAVPYNLDAWDGYFYEREVILGTAKQLGKKLVVLAGDTHNAWASNLKGYDVATKSEYQVGVEFATPSVSSPGVEEYASLTQASALQFEGGIMMLIDSLKYLNSYDRGFLSVTFNSQEVKAQWHFVDSNSSQSYAVNAVRAKSITVPNSPILTIS